MGEILSQTRLYADFGATPGGSAGGAIWLQRIATFKVTDERSVEIVKAIGVEGGAGFRRKTGGGTLMITENRQDKPQVDWRKLKRDKKVFMIMAQDENSGAREKWFSCTVSKIDRSANDDGEHQDEIALKFLQSVAS